MQKPTKKSRNNAFLAEKRLTAALGPRGTEFKSPHFDQTKTESRGCSPLSVFVVFSGFLPMFLNNYFSDVDICIIFTLAGGIYDSVNR